uniref:Uncharacterized protein n=1 Tax=Anguilla anguilla TaxID=7936 RepID=A0A0E9VA00_ANGAN
MKCKPQNNLSGNINRLLYLQLHSSFAYALIVP